MRRSRARAALAVATAAALSLTFTPFTDAAPVHVAATDEGALVVRPQQVRASLRPTRFTSRAASRTGVRPMVNGSFGTSPTANWVATGIRGRVNIGVLDFFDARVLTTQQRAREIPVIPIAHRFCRYRGTACAFGPKGSTNRGNAIVETIIDQAPGATLFLAEVGTAADYRAAIDWFVANGVKIVHHSSVGVYDGPGNGTGVAASIIDYAVAKGLTWFQAAGDAGLDPGYAYYRGGYWRGTWTDPDGDGWLNFKGNDETLGTLCGALLGLRWSDWSAARTDYELWIGDMTAASGRDGTASLAADKNQATGGAVPIEGNDFRWLCNTNPAAGPVYDKNGDHLVHLKVKRSKRSTAASSVGDRLEIQVHNGWFEYSTNPGAAAVGFADTKNPGAATIGHYGLYSSMGPTNDGRIKPDLTTDACWPNSVTGECYLSDSYNSAEVASAITAGTAAVALEGLGPMKPAQLVQFLRNNASSDSALDAAEPLVVPSNQMGFGEVRLRGIGPQTATYGASRYTSKMRHVIDTRVANNVRAGTAPIARNASLTLHVDNEYVSPPDATRLVAINLTTLGTLGAGVVQVGPAGWMIPGSSTSMTIRAAGETQSSFMVVPVGPDQEIVVHTTAGGHFIVEQLGYFTEERGDGFHAVTPYRAYDTRALAAPLAARTNRYVKLTGSSATDPQVAVPAKNVRAVALSITADAPTAAGWATAVSGASSATPTMAELWFAKSRTTTNTVIVPVDAVGRIRLYSTAATHFQVDVLGYFSDFIGGSFHYHQPVRVTDTRRGGAAVPAAGMATDVNVSSQVPSDAASVFGTLSTIGATSNGAVRMARNSGALGTSSSFRSVTISTLGQAASVGTFSALDAGHASIVATTAAHRMFDVLGWFDPVEFAIAGSVTSVPVDPAAPSASRLMARWSPNGRKVLLSTSVGGVGGLTVLDRDTATFTALDLTAGDGTPDASLIPMAVSDDGTRVAFFSAATNITPAGADAGVDWFLLDTAAGTLQRLNERADGTQIAWTSDMAVNTAVTEFVQWDGTAQVTNLLTGVTTADPLRLRYGGNAQLTGAAYNDVMWSAFDGALHTLPTGTTSQWFKISPDGRYLFGPRYNADRTSMDMYLFDASTNTDTVLCTNATLVVLPFTMLVDWSSGPPTIGEWCHSPAPKSFSVLSAAGLNSGPGTRDGRHPVTAANSTALYTIVGAANGEVLFSTNAANIGPSGPVDWLVYDNPDL